MIHLSCWKNIVESNLFVCCSLLIESDDNNDDDGGGDDDDDDNDNYTVVVDDDDDYGDTMQVMIVVNVCFWSRDILRHPAKLSVQWSSE